MLNLTKKMFNQIKSHANQEKPNECCGLLVNIDGGTKIMPCKNTADNKKDNFSIDALDYMQASDIGKIIAFYHSHCEVGADDFSLLDKYNSINHKLPLILYYLPKNEFKVFDEHSLGCEYIGKPFTINKQDCLTLVESFYSREFNILLPHEFRDEHWMQENPRRILENIEKFGFFEIKDNFKFGDIILVKHPSLGLPVHLMIYLNHDQILHHRYQGYSTIEIYNNFYKQMTYGVARHHKLK